MQKNRQSGINSTICLIVFRNFMSKEKSIYLAIRRKYFQIFRQDNRIIFFNVQYSLPCFAVFTVPTHLKRLLPCPMKSRQQTFLVYRFQKAKAHFIIDLVCTTNDLFCYIFHVPSLWLSAPKINTIRLVMSVITSSHHHVIRHDRFDRTGST